MDPLAEFESYCRLERGYAERTTDLYIHELKRIERFLNKEFTRDTSIQLTALDLRTYIARRSGDVSLTALRSAVKAAQAFERFGVISEWWPEGGILHVKLPMAKPKQKAPLSDEEVSSLLLECRTPTQFRILWLGLFAATRISEALVIDESRWQDDRLVFPAKGDTTRAVPVHPSLASVREVVLSEQPTLDQARSHLENLRGDSGVTRFTPHLGRHTFSTKLLEASVALHVVEALMGHSHRSTTLRHYAHVPWDQMVQAMSSLDYGPTAAYASNSNHLLGRKVDARQARITGAGRSVHSIGHHTGAHFIYDCDDARWHLLQADLGSVVLTLCGERKSIITDELAAELLAATSSAEMSICARCGRKMDKPPMMEPPRRLSATGDSVVAS